MRNDAPASGGKTYCLSAGPGAGKTPRLKRWAAEWGDQALYIKVTAEKSHGQAFREHLLAAFPPARERFQLLEKRFPDVAPGALLATALAETCPQAGLLIDDVHLAEGTPLQDELSAFVRHFSAAGRLALASRHQLPALGREDAQRWDADHPDWTERPTPWDLRSLPPQLLGKALALSLLGTLPPSEPGLELIRRNIARRTPQGEHALRAPWRPAAEQALGLPGKEAAREHLRRDLERFVQHQARTLDDGRIAEALAGSQGAELAPETPPPGLCLTSENQAPLPRDEASLQAILAQPALTDRLAHHRHFQALQALSRLALERGDLANAAAHAERMVHLAMRFRFTRDLIAAHLARIDAQLRGPTLPGLSPFLALPPEAFGEAEALPEYLRGLRDRAALLAEPLLAERLDALLRRERPEAPPMPAPPASGRPLLKVRVFGAFAFVGPDGAPLRWPRRKTLALMGLLSIHRRGLFADELAGTLFDHEEVASAQEMLNTVTYTARRLLKAAVGEDLIDVSGGCYRLRWSKLAYCDLHEFEAFREQAQLLEALGFAPAAALMRDIALAHVSGPPLPELEDELPVEHHNLLEQIRALQSSQEAQNAR